MTDLTAERGGTLTRSGRVRKPRKTYPQNWRAYNLAQARERRDFVYLLRDLCATIPDELSFQEPRGRHRIPLRDLTFSVVLQIYRGHSGRQLGSRRDGGPVVRLQRSGFISRAMHWNSVGNALRDERMQAVFQYLVETSALPLVPVEQGYFSIDGSVVDGSIRIREGEPHFPGQRQWRIGKVHFIVGNRSHVVTAAAVESPGAGESPLLPALAHTTSKSFEMKYLFGDKAYTDHRSYSVAEALGVQGVFPFKKGHSGPTNDAFSRMYHWVEAHSDEFWDLYFRRNNVEATISSWKRALMRALRNKTATLRSRNEIAMRNEIYGLLIAHNIRVVIRFMYLLGIAPTFLPAAKDSPAYPTDDSAH